MDEKSCLQKLAHDSGYILFLAFIITWNGCVTLGYLRSILDEVRKDNVKQAQSEVKDVQHVQMVQ